MFFIQGRRALKKSTVVNYLIFIISPEFVHTITLKALNIDMFKILHLIIKRLIIINDTNGYIQNMDIVKAYVRNDSLRGRHMNKQGTVEVFAEKIIVAGENFSLSVRGEKNSSVFNWILEVSEDDINHILNYESRMVSLKHNIEESRRVTNPMKF